MVLTRFQVDLHTLVEPVAVDADWLWLLRLRREIDLLPALLLLIDGIDSSQPGLLRGVVLVRRLLECLLSLIEGRISVTGVRL